MNTTNRIDLTNNRLGITPASIARDPSMTVEDKRALLASWASDARAVRDHPALRRLDDGSLVHIDDVLTALKSLDRVELSACQSHGIHQFRRGHWSRISRTWRRGRDDDDDDSPPPVPSPVAPYQPLPSGSLAAAAA